MQYIGLDLHAKSFSVAVLDEHNEVQWERTRATSGANLVQVVKGLAGAKVVAVEESTMADWAFRVLSPHAKVIVCDPRENHWIAKDENITDGSAARKLARLLRMGMVKPT